MRVSLALRNVADSQILESMQSALRKNGGPMMIKDLANAAGVSLTTAGKYVDILQAGGVVSVRPFATAKLVTLRSTSKGGVGEGR